mmetsp:Transcript_25216/g.49607  ORF Transcript_25216/g.49607 Transcript_25216/m.49607 type:complete len:138 (+) Transcript_25216:235-648(+)
MPAAVALHPHVPKQETFAIKVPTDEHGKGFDSGRRIRKSNSDGADGKKMHTLELGCTALGEKIDACADSNNCRWYQCSKEAREKEGLIFRKNAAQVEGFGAGPSNGLYLGKVLKEVRPLEVDQGDHGVKLHGPNKDL